MATVRRLTDSCLVVTTDAGATLFDPGFHTFGSGAVDLDGIGDIQRVLITHEHGDHVHPEFVKWLLQRRRDLTIHANDAVAALLAAHDVEVDTGVPSGVSAEDGLHEPIPTGATPPNRSWTIDGVFTHPGDSYGPTATAPVMALPLIAPWGSATASVAFARKLRPRQVVPIHDFYMSDSGRAFITGLVGRVLGGDDIELLPLDWGESATI